MTPQTELEKKIEPLVEKYSHFTENDESLVKDLKELATYVYESLLPNQDELDDDLYNWDAYPHSHLQAKQAIEKIQEKAKLLGIKQD